jgi:hypothetical protein
MGNKTFNISWVIIYDIVKYFINIRCQVIGKLFHIVIILEIDEMLSKYLKLSSRY